MSKYIVEKFANFLQDEEISKLVAQLKVKLGGTAPTARECDISRPTIYGLESRKEEVKLETKKRILEQALKVLPEESLHYITSRMSEDSVDILQSYLEFLYQKAIAEKNPTLFKTAADEVQKTFRKYTTLPYKRLEYQVNDMLSILEEHGDSIGSDWKSNTVITNKDSSTRSNEKFDLHYDNAEINAYILDRDGKLSAYDTKNKNESANNIEKFSHIMIFKYMKIKKGYLQQSDSNLSPMIQCKEANSIGR